MPQFQENKNNNFTILRVQNFKKATNTYIILIVLEE